MHILTLEEIHPNFNCFQGVKSKSTKVNREQAVNDALEIHRVGKAIPGGKQQEQSRTVSRVK